MQEVLPLNRIAHLIQRDGVKPVEVAAHCGVDQSTLYRWRTAATPIPDGQKFKLARYFKVSVPFLMGWDDDEGVAPEVSALTPPARTPVGDDLKDAA